MVFTYVIKKNSADALVSCLTDLSATLRQHMHGILFVKGAEKIRWLRELSIGHFHIVNPHQFGCPTLQRMRKTPCLSDQTNVFKLAEYGYKCTFLVKD